MSELVREALRHYDPRAWWDQVRIHLVILSGALRIRLMNPHAQSKDPCTPTLSQPRQGVLPHLRRPSTLRASGVNRVCIHLVYILSYTSCHPERSMRIRFMNPRAQSKDLCTPTLSQPLQGVLPHLRQASPLRAPGVNRVCIHLVYIFCPQF